MEYNNYNRVDSLYINTSVKTIQKIVQDCPEGALEIISTGSTAGTGIAGAQTVVCKLDRELNAIEVSEVESS